MLFHIFILQFLTRELGVHLSIVTYVWALLPEPPFFCSFNRTVLFYIEYFDSMLINEIIQTILKWLMTFELCARLNDALFNFTFAFFFSFGFSPVLFHFFFGALYFVYVEHLLTISTRSFQVIYFFASEFCWVLLSWAFLFLLLLLLFHSIFRYLHCGLLSSPFLGQRNTIRLRRERKQKKTRCNNTK